MSQFLWSVCEAGYRWERSPESAETDPVLGFIKPWPMREYEPLETEPALFQEFAHLQSEPDAILRFANRFGPLLRLGGAKVPTGPAVERPTLKVPTVSAVDSGSTNRTGEHGRIQPETLAFWTSQIESMRSAVAVWEMVCDEKDDPGKLGDVAGAIELGCRDRVESRYEFDRTRRGCGWVRTPHDLAGALWLQFADAVAGDKKYRRCPAPGCGKWYELPRLRGPDRNQCSTACKQRAARHRKALELFAKGWTDEEVAKKVGTTLKTVKEWRPVVLQADGGDSTQDKGTRLGLDM